MGVAKEPHRPGHSFQTLTRAREVLTGLRAQKRHWLQLIRDWGQAGGCGCCQGYLEGHSRPARFLSLSACGSLWDRPGGLKNIPPGPGIEGSGWWRPRRGLPQSLIVWRAGLLPARGGLTPVTAAVIRDDIDDNDRWGSIRGTDPGRPRAKHFSGMASSHPQGEQPCPHRTGGETDTEGWSHRCRGPQREVAGGDLTWREDMGLPAACAQLDLQLPEPSQRQGL